MWNGNRRAGVVFGVAGFLTVAARLSAAPTALSPVQWNMIQNGSFTANSDGTGYHSFSGGGKESLLQFDFSSIPAGATITAATLTMYTGRSSASSPEPIFIYRLTSTWGMGTSGVGQTDNGSSNGGGGTGYTVTNNDATWFDRFYNAAAPGSSSTWTTAGGDYVTGDSASAMVPVVSSGPALTTWSGAGLVSDVQNWLMGANVNDGWILNDFASTADFGPSGHTFGTDAGHRFIMPANSLNSTNGPLLTLTFTVPEPASLGLVGLGAMFIRRRRRD
jgi:hypothetical protein